MALSLCKNSNEIDTACEIYELQLREYFNDKDKLCSIYQHFADYCIKWGRFSKAQILLQKKLRFQKHSIKERDITIECLFKLSHNQFSLTEHFEGNISLIKYTHEDLGYLTFLEGI